VTLKRAAARRATANAAFEAAVVKAAKSGNTIGWVAEQAGISRPTVYAILNRNKKES
jgi:DNA invertase Pin-like site-specific DNA recombinase